MKIYLVRHGETDYNVQKLVQGHSDIPLNARGESQGRYAAKRFAGVKLDAIYSSDLTRAVRTAQLLTGGDPIQDEALREKWMDNAEGLPVAEVYGWDRTKDPILDYGETELQLRTRMHAALDHIVAKHKYDESILIVAHGACLRALYKDLVITGDLDAGEWKESIVSGHKSYANCSLTIIDNGKLIEYATPLVDEGYVDPTVA